MRGLALVGVLAVLSLDTPCLGQGEPDPTDLDLDGVPGLAPPPAIPQAAAPSVLVGTGQLLIDRSHNEAFDVSGLTSFLLSQGWVVAENYAPITDSILTGQDILMIPTRSVFTTMTPFSAAEVSVIQGFLQGGKGLWVLHDNLDPTSVNTLTQTFGISYLYDYVQDPTNNEGNPAAPTIHLLTPHAIVNGVESYGYYLGDCISVMQPASIVGRADEDSYSLYCLLGTQPPTLAVWQAGGRAVFSGDITPLHPNYYSVRLRPEEQLLLQNIANWLLGDSPTAVSPTTWGSVKSRYSFPASQTKETRPMPSP